jgi:hypothetical protein
MEDAHATGRRYASHIDPFSSLHSQISVIIVCLQGFIDFGNGNRGRQKLFEIFRATFLWKYHVDKQRSVDDATLHRAIGGLRSAYGLTRLH